MLIWSLAVYAVGNLPSATAASDPPYKLAASRQLAADPHLSRQAALIVSSLVFVEEKIILVGQRLKIYVLWGRVISWSRKSQLKSSCPSIETGLFSISVFQNLAVCSPPITNKSLILNINDGVFSDDRSCIRHV